MNILEVDLNNTVNAYHFPEERFVAHWIKLNVFMTHAVDSCMCKVLLIAAVLKNCAFSCDIYYFGCSNSVTVTWMNISANTHTQQMRARAHVRTHAYTTIPFYSPVRFFSGTTCVSWHQKGKTKKVKPIWIYWSKR